MTQPFVDKAVDLALDAVETLTDGGLEDVIAKDLLLNLLLQDRDPLVDLEDIGRGFGPAREIEGQGHRQPGDDITDLKCGVHRHS